MVICFVDRARIVDYHCLNFHNLKLLSFFFKLITVGIEMD